MLTGSVGNSSSHPHPSANHSVKHGVNTERFITRVSRLTMLSVPQIIALFGVLPLTLALAVIFYALTTGWFVGLVFGLIWLTNFAVFACLICWVNRNGKP